MNPTYPSLHENLLWLQHAKISQCSAPLLLHEYQPGLLQQLLPHHHQVIRLASLDTQLLTIPVYVGTAISIPSFDVLSHRILQRGLFLRTFFAIAAAAWIILLISCSLHLSYTATFLIGMGTFPY